MGDENLGRVDLDWDLTRVSDLLVLLRLKRKGSGLRRHSECSSVRLYGQGSQK